MLSYTYLAGKGDTVVPRWIEMYAFTLCSSESCVSMICHISMPNAP